MDSFNIQVMLKDGSFIDYEVKNRRNENAYEVFQEDKSFATFIISEDGNWTTSTLMDQDLKERIINQLNGLHR